MPAQRRLPFYRLDFARWKLFDNADGCKPLDNPQAAILMDRRPPYLPGEKALLAKQAAEKRKAEQKAASKQPHPGVANVEKAALKAANEQAKDEQPVEKCKAPPPFDMLDLPDAMDKMGFTVAAKLARRWFNGRKHAIPRDKPASYVYPSDMIDTETVTLEFVLKYQKVKEKYDQLITGEIYTDNAIKALKQRMRDLMATPFLDGHRPYSGNIRTLAFCGGDIQKLDKVFRFQHMNISSFDTLNGRFLTDLTASLANFNLNIAIANANVVAEKYQRYPKEAPYVFCCQFHVEVTDIYVYANDSYSFADITSQKASQYLGHWNRNGVILVLEAVAADRANRYGIDIELGDTPVAPSLGPVDTLQGWFGQMRKQDVYYPVHNRDYSTWREKFNRGGDFMIFTKPMKIKLPKPIKFTTEEICRPVPQSSGK